MADAEQHISEVAGAIGDGLPVDWNAVELTPMSVNERRLIAELRVLEDLHRVHQHLEPTDPVDPLKSIGETTSRASSDAVAEAGGADTNADTASEPILRMWGPLEIRGVLGQGGFGVVYRAWDPHLAAEVALKVLTRDSSVGASVIEEAHLLARVRHPNIVSIYGADRRDGQVGLWMELVRGRTLKQVLLERGAFGAREAALIGLDLTRALAVVHAAGLVHRDVKPHNVMREEGGRIVLMDFGAGVEWAELTDGPLHKYAGTPLYMAPELFDHRHPTPQSDLYSLGVLLYHVVTGTYPLQGSSPEDLQAAHQRGERRRLRDVRPDLPTEFVRIVERATDTDPAKRYASAGELEADLVQFAVRDERKIGGPVATRAIVPAPRRRFMRAGGLGAAAVALLVVLAFLIPKFRAWRTPATASPMRFRSLAVLPVVNMSGDASQEFFADGMTELLIADLSMIGSLKVISRTSVMSFKSSHKPLPEIARELKVDGVIESSVVRSGDRMRVTVKLIEAGTDFDLWSQHYESDVSDVLGLDGAIVQRIAREIGAVLSPPLRQRLTATRKVAVDAQDEYLRGRYAANKYTEAGFREALEHFEKAVKLDPDYSLAFIGLSNAHRALANRSNAPLNDEHYQLAHDAASRALALDGGAPGAHLALANTEWYWRWNWSTAQAEFARALDLNANDPEAHQQYAWFLAARGDIPAALEHAQKARELDPLANIRRTATAGILYYGRRYPEAVTELRAALAREPNLVAGRVGLGRTYAAMGMFDEALAEMTHAIELSNRDPGMVAELGRIYAQAGRTADADAILRDVESMTAQGRHIGAESFAGLYGTLGDRNRALTFLEEGVRQRAPGLLWLKVDPRFDNLRSDPRFGALLKAGGIE
jgi:serine/threonine-protein kinase